MKEPNVLEASGLCVNGNQEDDEGFSVQQFFFRLWHLDDAFYEPPIVPVRADGLPFGAPDSHGDIFMKECFDKKGVIKSMEQIKNPHSFNESWFAKFKKWFKRFIDFMSSDFGRYNPYDRMLKIPEPRNPPKPPPKKIPIVTDSVVWPNENIKFDCLSGNYKKTTFGDFKKALIGKSWFSKVKNWLKYWLTPFSDNHESHSKYLPRMEDIFNDDYYKRKAKAAESDQIKRAQKLGHALKYATIQSDQLGKSLIRMRRRKKRHSISTPITRAWK